MRTERFFSIFFSMAVQAAEELLHQSAVSVSPPICIHKSRQLLPLPVNQEGGEGGERESIGGGGAGGGGGGGRAGGGVGEAARVIEEEYQRVLADVLNAN